MSDAIYRFINHSPAPLVYMAPGVVGVERPDEAEGLDHAEVRPDDVLVLSELPTVDILHHLSPVDADTQAAMDLLAAVEPPVATETAPEATGQDAYPEGGTKDEVMDWVGDDRDRAREAMRREIDSDSPRSTVTSALERLASHQEG